MMFQKKSAPASRPAETEPSDVSARIGRGEIVLAGMHEPNEIAAERIPGAVSLPLRIQHAS